MVVHTSGRVKLEAIFDMRLCNFLSSFHGLLCFSRTVRSRVMSLVSCIYQEE